MKGIRLAFAEFEEKFSHKEAPLVRVFINHELLSQDGHSGRIKVYKREGVVPQDLVSRFQLYAPWHVSLDTNEPVMPDLDTRPIHLNQIRNEEENIRVHHITHIAAIREWFQSLEHSPSSTNIDIVTLRLGGKRLFVLDGNHRLSALIHELENGGKPNVTITEYRLKSKQWSSELLPDIITLID